MCESFGGPADYAGKVKAEGHTVDRRVREERAKASKDFAGTASGVVLATGMCADELRSAIERVARGSTRRFNPLAGWVREQAVAHIPVPGS